MALLTPVELARLLTPCERSVLIMMRRKATVGHETLALSPRLLFARLPKEYRREIGSAERLPELTEGIKRKVARAVAQKGAENGRGAALPRREEDVEVPRVPVRRVERVLPRRPAAESRTTPRAVKVPSPPAEVVSLIPSAETLQPTPTEENPMTVAPPPSRFIQRVERETRLEADRVIADLARVRFDAGQVIRVLRALNLDVPDDLAWIHYGESAPEAVAAGIVPDYVPPSPGPHLGDSESAIGEGEARRAAEAAEEEPAPPPAPPAPPPAEPPAQPEPTPQSPLAPGQTAAQTRQREENRETVLNALKGHPPEGLPLRMIVERAGLSQTVVSRHLRELGEDGIIEKRGQMRSGRYLLKRTTDGPAADAPPTPPDRTSAPAPAAPEPDDLTVGPEAERVVRDWVIKRDKPFTPQEVAEALDMKERVVRGAFAAFITRELITYVGFDDVELYEYRRPTEPGKAAETDAAARRTTTERERSQPVGGASGLPKLTQDKDTQRLIERAAAAGATVSKRGNNHIMITNPVNRKSVTLGSTEGSGGSNAKTKKRLKDIGIEV